MSAEVNQDTKMHPKDSSKTPRNRSEIVTDAIKAGCHNSHEVNWYLAGEVELLGVKNQALVEALEEFKTTLMAQEIQETNRRDATEPNSNNDIRTRAHCDGVAYGIRFALRQLEHALSAAHKEGDK